MSHLHRCMCGCWWSFSVSSSSVGSSKTSLNISSTVIWYSSSERDDRWQRRSHLWIKFSRRKAMNRLTQIIAETSHQVTKYNFDHGDEYLENASKNTCQLFTVITSHRVTNAAAKSSKLFGQYSSCSNVPHLRVALEDVMLTALKLPTGTTAPLNSTMPIIANV